MQTKLQNAVIHPSSKIYGRSSIGAGSMVMENVILGYPGGAVLKEIAAKGLKIEEYEYAGVVLGKNGIIRSNSTIYCDVIIGDDFRTGHNILVRENTRIGNNVLLGTNALAEAATTIGNNVSIQSNAYIPTNTTIEDNVFIGPCAVLTNDKYPIRKKYELKGPVLRKGASIGANSTILPGIEIGEGAMVAAGALVTKNVAPWKLAIGAPARVVELPDELHTINRI